MTQEFDFDVFPDSIRGFYQEARRNGFESVFHAISKSLKNDPSSLQNFTLHTALAIGEIIFDKLPKDEIKKYLPFNDFRFLPREDKIIVQCRALNTVNGSRGTLYYSRLNPTVEIDGTSYTISFSKHAIRRICERIHPHWFNYSGLGDIYAYLEENIYFEVCELRDGSHAITFWDTCGTKEFWHYLYVKNVLGEENLVSGQGQAYFRVGYCPIAFDGQFINAKTLLFPGYSKTPEHSYILNSDLAYNEKKKLRDKITHQDAGSLMETGDFSGIKWLHMNSLPQVIQMNRLVYDHAAALPSKYF